MESDHFLSIPTCAGSLAGILHLPERVPAPVVVCCHGLLSSKDGSKFAAIGEAFSRAGFATLRFDFSGCGESRASLGESLIASRMRDLLEVLNYVRRQPWSESGALYLLGSSMGGYLALLAAASVTPRIRAVVCWATPFDLERVALALESSGSLHGSFPPGFKLGTPRNLKDLPPVSHVFVLHGQQDEIVPPEEAVQIYHLLGEPRRLLIMETAEHRFLDPSCRKLAIQLSLDWFLSALSDEANEPAG